VDIIGSFPSPLFRAFEHEKHAHDLVSGGVFRLRRLDWYRSQEAGKRRDTSEGKGRLQVGGGVFTTKFVNPVYLLCMSGPKVSLEHLRREYGPHVVRISDPDQLVHDLASYWARLIEDRVFSIECVQVTYDKDSRVEEAPNSGEEKKHLAYSQKDRDFAMDCVYRIAVTMTMWFPQQEFIHIDLGKPLDYAKMISSSVKCD
jgi:hypothetical protein